MIEATVSKFKSWQEINNFLLQNQDNDPRLILKELLYKFDTESLELRRYQFRVSGEKYNASINAAYAQSIIDFQKSFNEIINAFYKGVNKSKRESPEIYFTIEKGSLLSRSEDLFELLLNLGKSVFPKMTDKQITGIVILAIICFSTYKGAELYLNYEKSSLEIETQNKTVLQIQDAELQDKKDERNAMVQFQNVMLEDKKDERDFVLDLMSNKKAKTSINIAAKEGTQLRQKIIDVTPPNGVDSIEINGELLNKNEVYNLQSHKDNSHTGEFVVTEDFKIIHVSIPDTKKVKLEVKRVNASKDPSFTLCGNADKKGALTQDEIGYICDAIKDNGQIITLQAKLFVRGSIAVKGEIISFVVDSSTKQKQN